VDKLTNVARLVAGDDFACALDTGGTVWCWGSNAKGQLSSSETAGWSFTPRQVILNVSDLTAGGQHACVITTDGFARCWGDNTCGIFGQAGGGIQANPGELNLPPVLQISLGPDAMCVTTQQNQAQCWGRDHSGSLGHDLASPVPCGGGSSDPIPRHVQVTGTGQFLDNVADVHMGSAAACARHTDGQVSCWGDNSVGALGQGFPDTNTHNRAIDVPALKAAQVDVRGQTACAIVAERLLCWGDGTFGQLESLAPSPSCGGQDCRALGYVIPGMTPVRELAVGLGSIATIKDDLTVWTWGRNGSAELGFPTNDPKNQPCSGGTCVPTPAQLANAPPLN
jgi:alpha-tubulin suppressor-like RCC1 family protein